MKQEKIVSIFVEKNVFALTDQGRILVSDPLNTPGGEPARWVALELPEHNGDGMYECSRSFLRDDD